MPKDGVLRYPRPAGRPQAQRLPLPPHRRPGLARRDQALPAAHRGRRLAGAHQVRPPRLRTVGRDAARRFLHPGRHPRDRRLRRRAAYPRRPRDRHPGPLAGRHRRVSGTGQHRRHRHLRAVRLGHLGRQPERTRPHRQHPALLRGRPRGAARPLPRRDLAVHPHRRRRVPQGPVEGVARRAGPHRRSWAWPTRTSSSPGSSGTSTAGSPPGAGASSAGTRSWRAASREGAAVSSWRGLRGRDRGGRGRPRRRHVPRAAGVPGPPSGRRPRRADAHRLRPHPGGRLPLRAGAAGAAPRRPPARPGRPGQRLDRGHGEPGTASTTRSSRGSPPSPRSPGRALPAPARAGLRRISNGG